ncbi:MAG: UPF0175 family protein [Anaerolineaceae bacterium]|nr:UPF0175 family protein [Anaerolineaceae bacterium]
MEINFLLPEKQFITESIEEITAKVRLYAAVGMYQTGELSMGAACELADVDRYTFLNFLKLKGIFLRTQTPDELEVEFQMLTQVD